MNNLCKISVLGEYSDFFDIELSNTELDTISKFISIFSKNVKNVSIDLKLIENEKLVKKLNYQKPV